MTKRLALIDPDLLTRILSTRDEAPLPPNPQLKEMQSLRHNMEGALKEDDSKGKEAERLRTFNDALGKYMTHRDKYADSTVLSTPPSQPSGATPGDPWEEEIVASMPSTYRDKARLLVRRIKNSGGKLGWNPRGELTLSGETVAGTNIVDLIADVIRKRKTVKPPPGSGEFSRGLRDINIPREAVGNPDRVRSIYNDWTFPATVKRGLPTQPGRTSIPKKKKKKPQPQPREPRGRGVRIPGWEQL